MYPTGAPHPNPSTGRTIALSDRGHRHSHSQPWALNQSTVDLAVPPPLLGTPLWEGSLGNGAAHVPVHCRPAVSREWGVLPLVWGPHSPHPPGACMTRVGLRRLPTPLFCHTIQLSISKHAMSPSKNSSRSLRVHEAHPLRVCSSKALLDAVLHSLYVEWDCCWAALTAVWYGETATPRTRRLVA